MKHLVPTLAAILMTTATAPAGEPTPAAEARVFELRTYYAEPGKMKALHARFRDHTCKLFVTIALVDGGAGRNGG